MPYQTIKWERVKHLLPDRESQVGVTAIDNRLFVAAVLYPYRAGMPSYTAYTMGKSWRMGESFQSIIPGCR